MGEKKTRKKEKEDKKVPTLTTESWKKPDNIAAAKEMFLGTQIFEIGKVCTLVMISIFDYRYPKFISI